MADVGEVDVEEVVATDLTEEEELVVDVVLAAVAAVDEVVLGIGVGVTVTTTSSSVLVAGAADDTDVDEVVAVVAAGLPLPMEAEADDEVDNGTLPPLTMDVGSSSSSTSEVVNGCRPAAVVDALTVVRATGTVETAVSSSSSSALVVSGSRCLFSSMNLAWCWRSWLSWFARFMVRSARISLLLSRVCILPEGVHSV